MSSAFSIRASAFVMLLATSSSAQTAALAENLFRDGRKLLEQKRYDEACPKLAESARLEPSSGVEIALGLCYEAAGKTASAWGAFTATVPLARRDGRPDREQVAASRAKALESSFARVTFSVDEATAALAGLELREDGVLLNSAAWTDVPVDPGVHRVEVQAPGHVRYTQSFTVGRGPAQETIAIPALSPALSPAVSPAVLARVTPRSSPQPVEESSPWRTFGIVTGAAGIAAVVGGSVLGAMALGDVANAQNVCPSPRCNNATAVQENANGGTLADASTGLFIAGGALITAGVLAFVLGSPAHGSAPRTPAASYGQLVVSPRGVGWGGAF